VTIYCYHSIQDDWTSSLAVTTVAFDAQCQWLSRNRTVLPLATAMAKIDRDGLLPRGMAVLTFDDGFASMYHHAWPILRKYKLPASLFVVAETLTPAGRPVDWVDDPPTFALDTVTPEQVLEMSADGIDFQSHSYSHHDLTTLTPDDCETDLRMSREVLEDLLRRPVTHLAYPRGRNDDHVREAARRSGFRNSYTLPEHRETVDEQGIPRVGVFGGNGQRAFRVKSHPRYLAMRHSGLYAKVRTLKGFRLAS